MRKYLFLLMAALVLVACGNANADSENVNDSNDSGEVGNNKSNNEGENLTAHIDIRDEVIGDSYQVMRLIEKAIDKDEEPNMNILFDYTDKYVEGYDEQELNEQEFELVSATTLMVIRVDSYITIGSERRDFELDKEKWYKTLETGEYQADEGTTND